jgi:hypothetical protein
MAQQLSVGQYVRRDGRFVNLASPVTASGVTTWTGTVLGPTGGSDPLGTDTVITYQETGAALPNGNNPPIAPLAFAVPPSANVAALSQPGSNIRGSDILAQVGGTQSTLGNRG